MIESLQNAFDAVKNGIAQRIPEVQLDKYKSALIATLLDARRHPQTPELRNLIRSVMEKITAEGW